MNLQRFIDAKQEELAVLRRAMPAPLAVPRPDFEAALRAAPRVGGLHRYEATGDCFRSHAEAHADDGVEAVEYAPDEEGPRLRVLPLPHTPRGNPGAHSFLRRLR